ACDSLHHRGGSGGCHRRHRGRHPHPGQPVQFRDDDAHHRAVGRTELLARTGELMARTPADRRRTAAGRGGLALTLGIVPALFGAILATQQPWTWHRGGWALTVFIAVSAANLLGAVFV